MAASPWVEELVLPISEYATVGEDGTLRDALQALSDSQIKVRPGGQPHRAVLVQQRDGTIVGKLGYHAVLSALLPEQRSSFYEDSMRRAGLYESLVDRSLQNLDLLQMDLPSLCERAEHVRIRDMLLERPETIASTATERDLLAAFARLRVHSLVVTDQGEVSGIVRISDLFDKVTDMALGRGPEGCSEEER